MELYQIGTKETDRCHSAAMNQSVQPQDALRQERTVRQYDSTTATVISNQNDRWKGRGIMSALKICVGNREINMVNTVQDSLLGCFVWQDHDHRD